MSAISVKAGLANSLNAVCIESIDVFDGCSRSA